MTPELQRAMATYEEARFRYRKALLASLNGASNGKTIQQAIRAFQLARAELRRLEGAPAAEEAEVEPGAVPPEARNQAWSFVRRLLKAS
jgi:hypothetical protein